MTKYSKIIKGKIEYARELSNREDREDVVIDVALSIYTHPELQDLSMREVRRIIGEVLDRVDCL
jgi:CO dehydrogenase/acetyl-CoA synthase delta subunit